MVDMGVEVKKFINILSIFVLLNLLFSHTVSYAVDFINLGDPQYNVDRTGQTDTTSDINAVLSNLPGDEGAVTILVPNGKYLVKDLLITGRVNFIGEGDDTIFIASGNCVNGVLYVLSPRVRISKIKIDGDEDHFACSGIKLQGPSAWGTKVEDNKFINISKHAIEAYDVNHIEISNNMVNGGGQGMISCDGCDNASIHHNIFQDDAVPFAIELKVSGINKNTHSASIHNNWFEWSGSNTALNGVIVDAQQVSIFDNHFLDETTGFQNSHILVDDDADSTQIFGNNFAQTSASKIVDINSGALGTTIFNNRGFSQHHLVNDNGVGTVLENFDFTLGHKLIRSSKVGFTTVTSTGDPVLIDPTMARISTRTNEYFGANNADSIVQGRRRMFLRSAANHNVHLSDESGISNHQSGHIVLGSYHIWVDNTGVLRIKNGAPISDVDGDVVGQQ